MEIIASTLWVGGVASVVRIGGAMMHLPIGTWAGGIPKSVHDAMVPVGAAALGYYWYGPIGVIGGLIGAYLSFFVLLIAMFGKAFN